MKKLLLIVGLVCSLLLTNVCEAQVPWKKFIYFENWGGLNDNLSNTQIQDNEATEIQNITYDTGGALKKRNGFDTIGATAAITRVGTAAEVTGLQFYKQRDGTRFLYAVTSDDSNYARVYRKQYASGGGPTGDWDKVDWDGSLGITGQTISAPINYTANNQCDFAIASNFMVFTTGDSSKTPYVATGSGATFLSHSANIASATMVEYHKNHLFLAGHPALQSRVFFSELDDIRTWTATDFFEVETSDGSNVQGLVSAFDALYIFKDNSIWRLSGAERDTFRLEKMVSGVGTLSQQSVRVVGNLIYFVTRQNDIAVYDGAYTVVYPSQKIRNTTSGMNYSRAQYALGIPFSSYRNTDHDYYVSISRSGQSENDRILLFDTFQKAWTVFAGIDANAWTVGENSNFKDVLYFGDYGGFVHSYPSTNFYDGNVATTTIQAFYQTKWFRYPEVALGDKYWRLLKTYALSSDDVILNAEYKSDFEATGTSVSIDISGSQAQWDVAQWDVALWGGSSIIIGRNEINKGTEMFQLRYTETSSKGFTILGFENYLEGSDRI